MIKINNLSFSYADKSIFGNFSLEIPSGKRICISAESGRGKTTLLRLILGLEKPCGGGIETGGARMSAVFQEDRLLPFKTALCNITLIGADEKTALYNLSALGIGAAAEKYPFELSGGMRRRVAIARALSAEYDCIVLDEPFAGLDKENAEKAAKHILQELNGRTLIAVTHSEYEAQLLGAEIVYL